MTARIYLAGPILDRDDNGISWRERVKQQYDSFIWEDPLDKYVAEDGEWGPSRIVEEDLQMIDNSAGLLVRYGGERSFGTMMEIFYAAHIHEKPVAVWWDCEMDVSPWITHHTLVVTDSLSQSIGHLDAYFSEYEQYLGEEGTSPSYADTETIREQKADETMLS